MAPANESPKPAGRKPGHPPSLYELVHARRAKERSSMMTAFVISLVVHLAILILFAGVRFGVPEEISRVIEIQTDIVEDFRTPTEVTRRSTISMRDQASAADRGRELAQALGRGATDVEVMGADTLDLGGMGMDLLARRGGPSPTEWQDRADADLTAAVRAEGRDIRSAMDVLAEPIVQAVLRGPLRVVILFDGTRALEPQREMLGNQLQRTFDELRFAITERHEGRLSWSVVMFARRPRLILEHSREVEEVQRAIRRMPYDESGVENIDRAIRFCLENLVGRSHRTMIVMLTLEQGDDLGLEADASDAEKGKLEALVEECRRRNVPVFVLGREACFSRATGRRTLYTRDDGVVVRGRMNYGLSTCRRELPGRVYPLQVGYPYRASGFGAYSLSVIAHRTGGQFLIVSEQPSLYNLADIAPYEPEWVFPDQYDALNEAVPARRAIYRIAREYSRGMSWRMFRIRGEWHEQRDRWVSVAERVRDKLVWCDEAIRELVSARGQIGRSAPRRWEANYDLTLGKLYKMQAMLMQYRIACQVLLRHRPARPPRPDDADKRKLALEYRLHPARPRDDSVEFQGGSAERSAVDRAKRALENVIQRHPGTPWALRAQDELDRLTPLIVEGLWTPPPTTYEYEDI